MFIFKIEKEKKKVCLYISIMSVGAEVQNSCILGLRFVRAQIDKY